MPADEARSMISAMVSQIVSGFHPEEVILFGSRARGDAGPDSDVDLAVIVSELFGKRYQTAIKIRAALSGIPMPKDIVILTPQEYDEQKPLVGTLGHILGQEGKTLYRRAS